MTTPGHLLDLAKKYHENLPDRVYEYLNGRGIPDVLINFHLLGWSGWRITIPIFNRNGELAFFKLAKDPDDLLPGPKMIASKGSRAELYGWEQVLAAPPLIIICEGEFDRLVLEASGFYAVTSTGGAGTFKAEWAKAIAAIPEVYVCFDRDKAGQKGAVRVAQMIPQAKAIELPEEVGDGGDITDFFIRLGQGRDEFLQLIAQAKSVPPADPAPSRSTTSTADSDLPLDLRIEHIKQELPIEKVIGRYVQLRPSGNSLKGRCPFHNDRTPSLAVYPATGTYHCFGCGNHGDIINFIKQFEGLSFSQTLDAFDRYIAQYGSDAQNSS